MKKLLPKQKASIALAALRGEKISKLFSDYQVHSNQIWKWKKLAEGELKILFADKRKKENHSQERIIDELYKTIGRREVEISWLKKNSPNSPNITVLTKGYSLILYQTVLKLSFRALARNPLTVILANLRDFSLRSK